MKKTYFQSIKVTFISIFFLTILILVGIGWSYYSFVLKLIQEKENTYVNNIMNQIVENIENNSNNMKRYAKLVVNDSTVQKYLLAEKPLDKMIYASTLFESILNLTQDSQNTAIISILDTKGNAIGFLQNTQSIVKHLEENYDIFSPDQIGSAFTEKIFCSYDGVSYYTYFQTITEKQPYKSQENKIGTCVILTSISKLEKSITKIATIPNSVFMIFDKDLNIITSNTKKEAMNTEILQVASRILSQKNKSEAKQIVNDTMSAIQIKEIPYLGWNIVSVVPIHEIESDLTPLLNFGIFLIIAIILTFIWWSLYVFRSIATPIVEISSFLQKEAYLALHSRLEIKEENELGMLAKQINAMLDKISEMTRVIFNNQANMYELDLAKKRAEISALQSQINPHFLYNTLDCIKGYGYLSNSTEIVEIINALSSMMRYCIKGDDIVPLQSELNNIRCYLDIIHMRYEDRFEFMIDIPEAYWTVLLPRLILQPIVENAIRHGLDQKLSKGILKITSVVEEGAVGALTILIQDNGPGMDETTLKRINDYLQQSNDINFLQASSDQGLALINIQIRLIRLFGTQYRISIESVPDQGTCVKVKIPLQSNLQKTIQK